MRIFLLFFFSRASRLFLLPSGRIFINGGVVSQNGKLAKLWMVGLMSSFRCRN